MVKCDFLFIKIKYLRSVIEKIFYFHNKLDVLFQGDIHSSGWSEGQYMMENALLLIYTQSEW